MVIDNFLLKGHDGFFYEPESGRLFKIEEVSVTEEDSSDGKVRSRRKHFNGENKLCTHIIFFIMTGRWLGEGKVIDHKDNNSYNNSWENIREATKKQNSHNKQPIGRWLHTDKQLAVGVEVTPYGHYRVKLKGIHLGTFSNLTNANECTNNARQLLYGEFDYNTSQLSR